MTPQELKNSILQLAIQGKLVEQREEDGTAQELYQQIQKEKQALIKAGKIKKEKPLPEITEDEKPFDIPENWMWVRLRDVVYHRGQITPNCKFSYIDIGSIDNRRQRLNDNESLIEAKDAPSRARKLVGKGDILYSTVRPYLHNMCIIDREFSFMPIASTGFAAMVCVEGVYNKYLFNYLMSPAFDRYANDTDNSKGVAYPAINDEKLYKAVVPLPPLAEQRRIVAKIEELLPLIDRYDQAWSKLEDFNKRFPSDMQKSILQLAIQGKLVDQREEEGTGEELYQQIQKEKAALIKAGKIKKEKPLPEIAEDEIPFEIPESWRWVRCADIVYLTSGSQYEEIPCGVPYLKVADMNLPENISEIVTSSRFASNDNSGIIPINSIIFPKRGGAIATNKKKLVKKLPVFVDSNTMGMTMIIDSILEYINMWFSYTDLGKLQSGTSVPQINNKDIYPLLVPLPPLAEQKRIVARLEELLPLCERLK